MAHANDALNGILKQLKQAYASATAVYFAFGDAMLSLRKHGMTWTEAGEYIRRHFPNASADTGLTLSDRWLRGAHDTAANFASDGGLQSPDGKHRVSREDFQLLGLTGQARERVNDLLAYSASTAHIKGTLKLRVSDLATAVRGVKNAKNDADKAAAVRKLMARMDEVEASMTASDSGDELEQLQAKLSQAEAKLDRAQKRALKLKKEYDELRAEVQALQESRSTIQADATVSESAKPKARKVPPKRSAPAQRASGASA